jgi:hypothetical protein
MIKFQRLKEGNIVFRESFGNFKFYSNIVGLLIVFFIAFMLIYGFFLNPPDRVLTISEKVAMPFILILLTWLFFTNANKCRFEYYAIYFEDFILFCFVSKPIFKKYEIDIEKINLHSIFKFSTSNKNKVIFNWIDNNGKVNNHLLFFDSSFEGWLVSSEYKNQAQEILEFLNCRIQESKKN